MHVFVVCSFIFTQMIMNMIGFQLLSIIFE